MAIKAQTAFNLTSAVGSSDSGKSTIFKQMKIIYQKGFTEQERLEYRPVVYKNLTESAQDIVLAMHKLGMSPEDPLNHVNTSSYHPSSILTIQLG